MKPVQCLVYVLLVTKLNRSTFTTSCDQACRYYSVNSSLLLPRRTHQSSPRPSTQFIYRQPPWGMLRTRNPYRALRIKLQICHRCLPKSIKKKVALIYTCQLSAKSSVLHADTSSEWAQQWTVRTVTTATRSANETPKFYSL